jgi:hypothetical protein
MVSGYLGILVHIVSDFPLFLSFMQHLPTHLPPLSSCVARSIILYFIISHHAPSFSLPLFRTMVFYKFFDSNIRIQMKAKESDTIPLIVTIKFVYFLIFLLVIAAQLSFLSIVFVAEAKTNLNISFTLFAIWGILLGVNVFFQSILAVYALSKTNALVAARLLKPVTPSGNAKDDKAKKKRLEAIIARNTRFIYALFIIGLPVAGALLLPPLVPAMLRASDYIVALFSFSAMVILYGTMSIFGRSDRHSDNHAAM